MLYRVVLQGCAAAGSDLDEVKREFVRVTALPRSVTDQLFDGNAKVLKRQIAEADAERIVQTLRAIGAPATVEREPVAPSDVAAVGNPLAIPTQAPMLARPAHDDEVKATQGNEGAGSRTARRRRVGTVAGVAVLLAGILAAPVLNDWVRDARNGPVESKPVPPPDTPAAEASPPPSPAVRASSLAGSWRCTDQTSGVSSYWTYGADGTLEYHGEGTARGERPLTGPDVPSRWSLDGDRLAWIYPGRPPVPLRLTKLSFEHLDYEDTEGDPTRCIRA